MDHSDSDIFCRSSEWTDVAAFFLGNYVAHVATIHSSPGQSLLETILFLLTALFLPSAGVIKAFQAIKSRAIFADTELQRAARAGALFVVQEIRTESPMASTEEDSEKRKRRMTNSLGAMCFGLIRDYIELVQGIMTYILEYMFYILLGMLHIIGGKDRDVEADGGTDTLQASEGERNSRCIKSTR
jgi:hypothetical protein